MVFCFTTIGMLFILLGGALVTKTDLEWDVDGLGHFVTVNSFPMKLRLN